MSNPNDLVMISRGDVEALKQEAIFGVFRREAVEWDKLNAMLANAPVVNCEPVAYRHLHEDGWEYYDAPTGSDCSTCKALFTTPQPLKRLSDADIEVMIYEHTNFNVNMHEDGETVKYIKNLTNAIMDKMRDYHE